MTGGQESGNEPLMTSNPFSRFSYPQVDEEEEEDDFEEEEE